MMVREKHLCRGNRASEKAEPCRRVLEMTGQTVLLGCIQGMGSGAGAEQQEYTDYCRDRLLPWETGHSRKGPEHGHGLLCLIQAF